MKMSFMLRIGWCTCRPNPLIERSVVILIFPSGYGTVTIGCIQPLEVVFSQIPCFSVRSISSATACLLTRGEINELLVWLRVSCQSCADSLAMCQRCHPIVWGILQGSLFQANLSQWSRNGDSSPRSPSFLSRFLDSLQCTRMSRDLRKLCPMMFEKMSWTTCTVSVYVQPNRHTVALNVHRIPMTGVWS